MGCYAGRELSNAKFREAEEEMKAGEAKIGFRAISAQEVFLLLNNYKPASSVSRRVMERLLGKLGFADAEKTLQAGPMHHLLAAMQEGKGYSIKKLTLLAVLLSFDIDYTKAMILFTTYHTSPGPTMTNSETEQLAADAIHLALNLLVHYVESEAKARQDSEVQRKLGHYASVLLYGDEVVMVKLQRHLQTGGEPTEVEFLHKLASMPGSLLCSAYRLREYTYSIAAIKRRKQLEVGGQSNLYSTKEGK